MRFLKGLRPLSVILLSVLVMLNGKDFVQASIDSISMFRPA